MIARRLIMAMAALVMTRCETDQSAFEISPPTRLDIVMTTNGDDAPALVLRCDAMGGELIYRPWLPSFVAWICEEVNY